MCGAEPQLDWQGQADYLDWPGQGLARPSGQERNVSTVEQRGTRWAEEETKVQREREAGRREGGEHGRTYFTLTSPDLAWVFIVPGEGRSGPGVYGGEGRSGPRVYGGEGRSGPGGRKAVDGVRQRKSWRNRWVRFVFLAGQVRDKEGRVKPRGLLEG